MRLAPIGGGVKKWWRIVFFLVGGESLTRDRDFNRRLTTPNLSPYFSF